MIGLLKQSGVQKILEGRLRNKLAVSLGKIITVGESPSLDSIIEFTVSELLVPLIEGKLIPDIRISVESIDNEDIPFDEKFVYKASQVVNRYLSDSSFGVEELAEDLNLSRSQLYRKIKSSTGLSPNEFINEIRLQLAADRIRRKTDNITRISYSVGFNEQSYFSKKFRKRFGVSPSDYCS